MENTRHQPKRQHNVVDAIRMSLDGMAATSRQRQEAALSRLARRMPFPYTSDDCWSCQWHVIPVDVYSVLHRQMREDYQANTGNADRAIVRKVIDSSRRLGLMDADTASLIIETMAAFRGSRAPRRPYVEPTEAAKMFSACDLDIPSEARDACLLALLYAGAMRGHEGRGVAMQDVSFSSQAVLVTGKGNKQRWVQLTEGAMGMVRAWVEHRGSHDGALLCPVDRWGTIHTRQVDGSTIWRWVKRCYRRAGLEHMCPHDLRAASITRVIENGDIYQAQLHAGHSSTAITQGYDRTGALRLAATLDGLDFVGNQTQSDGQKNEDSLS